MNLTPLSSGGRREGTDLVGERAHVVRRGDDQALAAVKQAERRDQGPPLAQGHNALHAFPRSRACERGS